MKSLLTDLFKSGGRTPRARFAIALIVVVLSIWAQAFVLKSIPNTLFSFFLGLIWLCLNIYMLYCVFARRLHDVNLSAGLFFVIIPVTFLVMCVAVWVGGLDSYITAVQADPTIAQDEARSKAAIQAYQAELQTNMGWIPWVNASPLILLALFGLLKRSHPADNKYGPVPNG